MGISFSNAALLARARQDGVCFDRILTIGHQTMYMSRRHLELLARRFCPRADVAAVAGQPFADQFFRVFLDAKQVQSLDYSDHEGSDIIHDMNHPVDERQHDQFDAVIDGGSLEHVFNFPVAVANCMKMVRPGGSLFLFTMANNHCGHGFYQFSPELFFRIFQPANGFQVRSVILDVHDYPGGELSHRTRCYSVVDPAQVGMRVGLVSKSPVMMMVHAVKTESRPVFDVFPIQSDYQARFAGTAAVDQAPRSGLVAAIRNVARRIRRRLPERIGQAIDGRRQLWHYSLSNRRFYQRWDPLRADR